MAGPALEPSNVGHGGALAVLQCMVEKSSSDHPATVAHPGTTPPSTLPENSYPFFYRSIIAGLVPPFSSLFMAVLDHYGIQPLHFRPDSYLLLSIFAFYCEGFLGVRPSVALLRCFCSLEEGSRERLAGCVFFALGEGKWDRFPVLDFDRKAGRFWRHWAYLEVAEANSVFKIPTSIPVRHSGWAQGELAGTDMKPSWRGWRCCTTSGSSPPR